MSNLPLRPRSIVWLLGSTRNGFLPIRRGCWLRRLRCVASLLCLVWGGLRSSRLVGSGVLVTLFFSIKKSASTGRVAGLVGGLLFGYGHGDSGLVAFIFVAHIGSYQSSVVVVIDSSRID